METGNNDEIMVQINGQFKNDRGQWANDYYTISTLKEDDKLIVQCSSSDRELLLSLGANENELKRVYLGKNASIKKAAIFYREFKPKVMYGFTDANSTVFARISGFWLSELKDEWFIVQSFLGQKKFDCDGFKFGICNQLGRPKM